MSHARSLHGFQLFTLHQDQADALETLQQESAMAGAEVTTSSGWARWLRFQPGANAHPFEHPFTS